MCRAWHSVRLIGVVADARRGGGIRVQGSSRARGDCWWQGARGNQRDSVLVSEAAIASCVARLYIVSAAGTEGVIDPGVEALAWGCIVILGQRIARGIVQRDDGINRPGEILR